jgi:hypothetical protein
MIKVGDSVKVTRDGNQKDLVGIVKVIRPVPSGHDYIVFFPDDSNDFKESEIEK